jgi:hypothetical protein
LVGRYYVRRQNIYDISEGSEEYAATQEKFIQARSQGRQVSGVWNFEFDGSDAANVADIRYAGMCRELGETRCMNSFNCGNAFKDRLAIENMKIGVGCGAGDRVGRVGVSVKESAGAIGPGKGIVDAVCRECSRERKKSAGQALRRR